MLHTSISQLLVGRADALQHEGNIIAVKNHVIDRVKLDGNLTGKKN